MKKGSEPGDAHVDAFAALAHPMRLRVVFHLVRAGGEASAGAIQTALKLPGPTLSHYLDQLRRAGLVSRRRERTFLFYSVRRERVRDLVRLLTACC